MIAALGQVWLGTRAESREALSCALRIQALWQRKLSDVSAEGTKAGSGQRKE